MIKLIGFLSNEKLKNNCFSFIKDEKSFDSLYEDDYLLLSQSSDRGLAENASIITYQNDKHLLIISGSIYNVKDLKDKYTAKEECNKVDTYLEIILDLYSRKGKDFIKDLSGMFSIVIWDKKKKVFFSARDNPGMRHQGGFIFPLILIVFIRL